MGPHSTRANGIGARRDEEGAAALTEALLESHWPACDQLAGTLAQIGTEEARQGLMRALKGRRHHIRSAALKALAALGAEYAKQAVAVLADDPAYEVQQDVAEVSRQIGAGCDVPRKGTSPPKRTP